MPPITGYEAMQDQYSTKHTYTQKQHPIEINNNYIARTRNSVLNKRKRPHPPDKYSHPPHTTWCTTQKPGEYHRQQNTRQLAIQTPLVVRYTGYFSLGTSGHTQTTQLIREHTLNNHPSNIMASTTPRLIPQHCHNNYSVFDTHHKISVVYTHSIMNTLCVSQPISHIQPT